MTQDTKQVVADYVGVVYSAVNGDPIRIVVPSSDAENNREHVENTTRDLWARAKAVDPSREDIIWDVFASTRQRATVRHQFEGPGASDPSI